MVCPAAVKDPHLGKSDVYYCDGGFGVMVEVPQRTARGPSSGHVWLVRMA